MTKEQKINETARLLFHCAQIHYASPYYSKAEDTFDRIMERAELAGCPIIKRIDLTRGENRRVCTISAADAMIVAEYYESYIAPHYTVKFYMKNGDVRISKNRDKKEVERLRSKGVLIEAIEEK